MADRHINLVETPAEEIAELCLANPRVVVVRVKVEKLDVEPDAAGVDVEIERRPAPEPPANVYLLPRRLRPLGTCREKTENRDRRRARPAPACGGKSRSSSWAAAWRVPSG